MNKIAGFLVDKRIWLLTIFLLMAVGSVFLMMKININTDMALYLPDDSRMKQGKELMTAQLPDTAKQQSQMRVMFDGLSDEEKVKMKDRLAGIAGVASVTWVPDSVDYNKDGHTLYVLKSDAEYGTEEFGRISEALERDYAGNYKVYWHDDNLNNNALTPGILLGALGILLLVLLAMSNSWLEPFIFLFSVGVAVVINMGPHAFLPNVSQMTNSLAALMQLVLSMDYAIILSNRYRQAAKLTEDHAAAMKVAIRQAIPSMCSSAVTTIVGLLALCFMSFKIGADMGIVFAKGVFLSLIGCFTVLPAMLLLFNRPIQATAKKSLNIPTGALAKFSTKLRYIIAVAFVAIFVVVFILKGGSGISYVLPLTDEAAEVFPKDNNIAVLYSNTDEEKIPGMAETLSTKTGVRAVNAYSTTLGKKMTAEEMMGYVTAMFPVGQVDMLDVSIFKFLYYDHYADRSNEKISVMQLMEFMIKAADENPLLSGELGDTIREKLSMNPKASSQSFPVQIPEGQLTAAEMYPFIKTMVPELSESMLSLAYGFYFSQTAYDDSWKLSIDDLMQQVSQSEAINSLLDAQSKLILTAAVNGIESGKKQLVGPQYSLMAVTTELIDGSDEAMHFTEEPDRFCGENLKGEYYLIGSTPMSLEMSRTFDAELNKITIITAIAIFLVVLITFRNFLVPLILVALIQCSVYITMVAMRVVGVSMYYVALLIVQSILMGATIDYAIVFTNFYRDKRSDRPMPDAMKSAYKASIRTILTSGLVMALCTSLLGFAFEDPGVGQICHILAIGTFSALIMILFILPGVLAACDRFVAKRDKARTGES